MFPIFYLIRRMIMSDFVLIAANIHTDVKRQFELRLALEGGTKSAFILKSMRKYIEERGTDKQVYKALAIKYIHKFKGKETVLIKIKPYLKMVKEELESKHLCEKDIKRVIKRIKKGLQEWQK